MLKMPTRIDQYQTQVLPLITSKFVEWVVASRFTAHAERHRLFPSNQSAYRPIPPIYHNTETAVVSVKNDIIRAMDRYSWWSYCTRPAWSERIIRHRGPLYAARCFSSSIFGGKRYIPLVWFYSYLSNRSQYFFVDGVQLKLIGVDCTFLKVPF